MVNPLAPTLDKYGRVTSPTTTPVVPATQPPKAPPPVDQYGRVMPGLKELPNAPRVFFGAPKPKVPTPAVSTINNTPPNTPDTPVVKDVSAEPPKAPMPTIAGVSISTLGVLLGAGSLGANLLSPANDTLVNSGWTSGVTNWLDGVGTDAFGTGAFSPAGSDLIQAGGTAGKTTMSNAMGYGMSGSVLAGLVGLSSGNIFKDTAAGLVGGVAGGAIGGSVGGSIIGIGAGPIGAFVGGFALTAITSALGPKPSNKTAAGSWNPNTDEIQTSSLGGKRYSASNNAARDSYFDGLKGLRTNLATYYGGEFENMPNVTVNMGGRDGFLVTYGNSSATFNDKYANNATASLEWVGKHMIMDLKNLPPDVAIVHKNLDYTQSFDMLSGDLAYAKDFRNVGTAMLDGTIAMDVGDPQQVAAILTAWSDRGIRLGLDKDYINQAVTTVRRRVSTPAPIVA